jgi:hypothetical protein
VTRSRKKHPITGWTTAKSEKKDKQSANRRLRRIVKQNPTKELLPIQREISDVYLFDKDGKQDCTGTDYEKLAVRK